MPISYNLFMYAVLTSYIITSKTVDILQFNLNDKLLLTDAFGGVAQMVERSLSMREVPGSIPGASINFLKFFILEILLLVTEAIV